MSSIRNVSLWFVMLVVGVVNGARAQDESPAGSTASKSADSTATETPASIPVESIAADEGHAPVAGSTSTADESSTRFDDIVVTATKRAQSVRDIPASITAIHGEDLEKSGARELKDFVTQIPGLTLQDGRFSDITTRKVAIRGVGPADVGGQGGNQTVGILIGDVPLSDPFSNFVTADLDPFDLRTVEVLKGPQGTTFGASALNGAIRYVMNEPELGAWDARGFFDRTAVDRGDTDNAGAIEVNAPLGDSLALRAAGVLQHVPGVNDNTQRGIRDADGRRKWSGRLLGKWQPTEDFTLGATFLKQSGRSYDLLVPNNPDGRRESNTKPGTSDILTSFETGLIDARYRFDSLGTVVLQGGVQKKHADTDLDAGLGPTGSRGIESLRSSLLVTTEGRTAELRLVSPDGGRWNWIVGAFVLDYDVSSYGDAYAAYTERLAALAPLLGYVITGQGISVETYDVNATAREKSLYGEISRRFGESWELTLGARRYETSLTGLQQVRGLLATTFLGKPERSVEQEDSGISPKASLVFKPSGSFMSYATISRGFQFGGVNSPAPLSFPFNNPVSGVPVPAGFESSTLWNREIGVRTDWLDRTLRADLTYFDLNWTNAQFGQNSGGQVQPTAYIDNVGKVRSRGLEGTVAWLTPVPGLSFTIAASYIKALTAVEYTDGSGKIVPSGTEMPGTPPVQLANTLSYATAVGPWGYNVSLAHSYWGAAWNNVTHDAPIYDFNLLNLNMAFSRPDVPGAPEIAVTVSNLTNVDAVYDRAIQLGVNDPYWSYGRPRAVSLRLSTRFN